MTVERLRGRDQKRGQEPIARWPGGCFALFVPDPFSGFNHESHEVKLRGSEMIRIEPACGRSGRMVPGPFLCAGWNKLKIGDRGLV